MGPLIKDAERGNVPPLRKAEGMHMFYDIESKETVTMDALLREYETLRKAFPDEYGYSFPEYVDNCLARNNGTLEPIKEARA